jgi:hypothetical protein
VIERGNLLLCEVQVGRGVRSWFLVPSFNSKTHKIKSIFLLCLGTYDSP